MNGPNPTIPGYGGWRKGRQHITVNTAMGMVRQAYVLKDLAERLYGEDWTVEADAVQDMADRLKQHSIELLGKLTGEEWTVDESEP